MKYSGSVLQVGNSLALVLPKSLCDIFEIKKGKNLQIMSTDSGLFIPIKPKELASIKDVIEKLVMEQ